MDTLLPDLLAWFRPTPRNFKRDKGAQQLPDLLAWLCADAFDFREVAVEFAALEIVYNFVIFHDYLN
jgi:hypothetical protein